MNRAARLALAALVTLPLAPAAVADKGPTADDILRLTDAAYSSFTDLSLESTMLIREPGQTQAREFSFTTQQKGDKRLVRFTAPGDVKGMGFLVESRDTMYVFLPGFQRVRRMGTHVKNQGFMGSDASFEDMQVTKYEGRWDAKLVGTEGSEWVLELTLKAGQEGEFPKEKIWVDQKIHQVTKIEDYDAAGHKQRTQTRSDFKQDEGPATHFTPAVIKIVDHRRNDHSTEIRSTKARVNSGIADDVFSQRSLVRG